MPNKYPIILFQLFTFILSQTINVEGKILTIGMNKSEALQKMQGYLQYDGFNEIDNNFWLQTDKYIIGSIGFVDEKLDYVTTDWDNKLNYWDSVNLFNTLFSAMKNTFGEESRGDITLELKEVKEENLEKYEITLFSADGKSIKINRRNISLDIKQIAKKL